MRIYDFKSNCYVPLFEMEEKTKEYFFVKNIIDIFLLNIIKKMVHLKKEYKNYS